MTDNQKNAKILCDAIRHFAENAAAIDNFESYLGNHFDKWLKKYASTPADLAGEVKQFSQVFDPCEYECE